MSISTQPLPSPPAPPARAVSVTTLLLSVALAACAAVALTLAVIHFGQPAAAARAGGSNPVAALLGDDPLAQKDTVSPQTHYTGFIYYPIPYASPPNLKLTAQKRHYDIVKQDETGFTWMARPMVEDFYENKRQEAESQLNMSMEWLLRDSLKPNLQYEDFTWEAKGLRLGKEAGAMQTFEQTGTFNTIIGKDGEENFPIPYALAPNVQLSGNPAGAIVIVESRPTGFKWKNGGDNAFFQNGSVTWKAKGIRATELPKPSAK